MILKIITGALIRQRRRMVLIALTVALGIALSTAMLNVLLATGDKVSRELKTYGANINVTPRVSSLLIDLYGVAEGSAASSQYLSEAELLRVKTIFWANNIVDFAPYLEAQVMLDTTASRLRLVGTWFKRTLELPTGESVETGLRLIRPWWTVEGAWVEDADVNGVMVGRTLARSLGLSPGDRVVVSAGAGNAVLGVRGVFDSGGPEDGQIFAPLALVQNLAGLPGLIDRAEVSALTTPDNELARRAAQNPLGLSRREWETWYCTAYVSSIAYQIEEAIPGSRAQVIRQVAESEGSILEKTQLLMLLITLLSLAGSALGISNLVTAGVIERSREIGLLKALGATDRGVSVQIFAEIFVIGLAGGCMGYGVGLGLAQILGRSVFGSGVAANVMVIPLGAVLVLVVTLAGSLPALRTLLSLRPAQVLHGR